MLAKFRSNTNLQKQLMSTENNILAESNPHDHHWGTGFSLQHPDAFQSSRWPGDNLTGKILMEVCEELRAEPKLNPDPT